MPRISIVLLWLVPGLFSAIAAATIRSEGLGTVVPAAWWVGIPGCLLLVGFVLLLRLGPARFDPLLLPVAVLLAAVGLAVVARLDPALLSNPDVPDNLLLRHLASVVLGLCLAGAVPIVLPRSELVGRYKYTWLVGGVGLLALTLVFGQEIRGARLWLRVGPIQVQPSELVRIALVVFLASYLADRRDFVVSDLRLGRLRLPPVPYLIPLVLAAAGSASILVLQNDLGTALLLFTTTVAMLYVATNQPRYVVIGTLTFAAVSWGASRTVPRLGIRLQNWVDPWGDPLVSGYQQVQSEYALAAGGALGVGLGRGDPTLIPDVHTDFVLTAIGEELGLGGTLAVIGLLLLVSLRAFQIALRAPAGVGRFLAAGLGTSVAVQTLL
ncbi:MAG TPA: FtsW/RodA/SpoVE family cell cycle protein, partial [Thermomicrobiales bacterium]|nr:FtsW/RodA/SpoVE family cell cycle protein [Thermomicrobiales bacterium]